MSWLAADVLLYRRHTRMGDEKIIKMEETMSHRKTNVSALMLLLALMLLSCGGGGADKNGGSPTTTPNIPPGSTKTWSKNYGVGGGGEFGNAIEQTQDGGYIVAGIWGPGGGDAWILKLNGDGSIAWQKSYGGDGYESAVSVHATADGGYIVGAHTTSFGQGGRDAWVLKLDGSGQGLWHYGRRMALRVGPKRRRRLPPGRRN